MLRPDAARDDPRAQPGAYISRHKRLLEVLDVDAGGLVWLEDCLTDQRFRVQVTSLDAFTLVRAAPPDDPSDPARTVSA